MKMIFITIRRKKRYDSVKSHAMRGDVNMCNNETEGLCWS